MKTFLFSTITACLLIIVSCKNDAPKNEPPINSLQNNKEALIKRINEFEAEMHKSNELNDVTANLAVKAYWDFSENFPNDSATADYLFKAGEISTSIKQYSQALMYYKKITDNFPNYKLITESYYLQAFLYDNYLNDESKAKLIYLKIILDYPNSSYAKDSKSAIDNLGKSDNDLIKEFKLKNSKSSKI